VTFFKELFLEVLNLIGGLGRKEGISMSGCCTQRGDFGVDCVF